MILNEYIYSAITYINLFSSPVVPVSTDSIFSGHLEFWIRVNRLMAFLLIEIIGKALLKKKRLVPEFLIPGSPFEFWSIILDNLLAKIKL